MLVRAAFAIFLAAVCRVCAQEALTDTLPAPPDATAQPIPDSAWLDLRQTAPQNSKTQDAPAWIDIEVPGDGKSIRAAYLDWMTASEVVHPVNAEHRDVIPEPFSSVPTLHAPPEDVENFGTVMATLATEPIRIDAQPEASAAF